MGFVRQNIVFTITIEQLELMLCLGASHQTCISVIQPSGNGKYLGNNDSSRGSGHNIHSGLDRMIITFKVSLI